LKLSKKDTDLVTSLVKNLSKQKLTISFAESITGGGMGEIITSIPGSSKVFQGTVVAYSNKSKMEILNVKRSTIKKYSEVSEEVAIEMATGAREVFQSDFAISTTGEAGPRSNSGQKVGKVWVGFADRNQSWAIELDFSKTTSSRSHSRREEIRKIAISSAFSTFTRILTP
jgi:nicotinamide-nucleotide amidase